jgi:LPS sulfotransferase NodH
MNAPELMKAAYAARSRGDFAAATGLYETALKIDPYLAPALRALSELSRQGNERLLERILRATKNHHRGSAEYAILAFAAAKCLDDLGTFPLSWQWLTVANDMQRALIPYDVGMDLRTMRQLAGAWPNHVHSGMSDLLYPVFIVGLPRSGSTLLERIVSAHPRIRSVGECAAIPDAVKSLATWSDYLDGPSFDIDPAALRAAYLERIPLWGEPRVPALRWVDKQLLNFCYIPLIARAFPQAKFLHIRRYPLAALYGIYRQRFPGTWQFAYNLTEIARFYAGYRELMRQWDAVCEAGVILEIEYERLVREFDPTVRQVLDFIGVEFDPACLSPHANPAAVQTMSSVQAREPVNDRGLYHFERYLTYLEPFRSTMGR